MPIKLVFEGMDAEEVLESIKTLFGPHFGGQVTEVTEIETVVEIDNVSKEPEAKAAPKKAEKPKKPKKAKKPKKVKKAKAKRGPCRDCGTTETKKWIGVTHPDGAQCQKCYHKAWAEYRKKQEKPQEVVPESQVEPEVEPTVETTTERVCRDCGVTETSLWRRVRSDEGPQCNPCYLRDKKSRRLTQHKPVKGSRMKQAKGKSKSTPKPQENEQEVEGSFDTWLIDQLRVSIFSSEGFILGHNLVQDWYKTQHGNDTQGMDEWIQKNQKTLYPKIMMAFQAFRAKLPTAIICQETGQTGPMMNVIDPSQVTSASIPTIAELQELLGNE